MEKELPQFPSATIDRLSKFYTGKDFTILDKREFSSASDIKPFLKQGMPALYQPGFKFNSSVELRERVCTAIGENTKVKVRYGNFHLPEEYAFNRQEKLLDADDYLDNYFFRKAHERHYLGNYELSSEALATLKIEPPQLYNKSPRVVNKIWMGEKGCVTPLHCDGSDNFIYQTYGSKKWTLIPPLYHPDLYINLKAGYPPADFWCSNVNAGDPDLKRFPKYAQVPKFEIMIYPGEGLYVPYGWFHYVETIEDSVMFNFWIEEGDPIPFVFGDV